MILAVVAMLLGTCVAAYGIADHDTVKSFLGLGIIFAVCVSWWFWVMFIIKYLMDINQRTGQSLREIKDDLKEMKTLLRDK